MLSNVEVLLHRVTRQLESMEQAEVGVEHDHHHRVIAAASYRATTGSTIRRLAESLDLNAFSARRLDIPLFFREARSMTTEMFVNYRLAQLSDEVISLDQSAVAKLQHRASPQFEQFA